MIDELFSTKRFNILSDNNNYYFFRALNNGDNDDIEKGITTSNNKIVKIRTDRERYSDTPKYSETSIFSLEEAVDHIKPSHRKDTNCISLSTSANVSIIYGREYYRDKYILVRIPKTSKIINASLFLLTEINKLVEQKDNYDEVELKPTDAVYYDYLSKEATDAKNKIIKNLLNTDKQVLNNISNYELAQTINNAIYSCEFIHYGDITEEEIIEISSNYMDAFSLLEQLPSTTVDIETVKEKVLNSLLIEPKIINYNFDYNVNNKFYYLIKSCLRRILTIEFIKDITNNKYETIYKELLKTYGVEKEIFSKCNTQKLKVNDKVNLNFSDNDVELIERIHNMNKEELLEILNNKDNEFAKLLNKYN